MQRCASPTAAAGRASLTKVRLVPSGAQPDISARLAEMKPE
jgi:hypothetical protein